MIICNSKNLAIKIWIVLHLIMFCELANSKKALSNLPKIENYCIDRFLQLPRRLIIDPDEIIDDENAMIAKKFRSACPTVINEKHDNLPAYAEGLRNTVQNIVSELAKNSESTNSCPGM